jgi:two-component system, response regulator
VENCTQVDILLVEDNPTDAEFTIRALRKNGLVGDLQWVTDGDKALTAIFGDDAGGGIRMLPRLMLIDLRLPKIGGLEVLKKVKSDPRTKNIPVVMLTSSTQEEDVAKCYALHANSFVSKPVRAEAFQSTIEQVGRYWLTINKVPKTGVENGL